MSETETYDARVQAIRAYNRPLLEDFGTWLDHKGFSEQTVITHLGNIYLFASYLVYYEPLKKLDEATESEVYWFLADWFPRKALWASVRSVQAYCASFKKFFQWMGETNRVSAETVAGVISTLKEERNLFLAQVAE
jgi:site-specific recombinase XerD